ncbi:DUF397 domain-containing protein [Streptomyces sp. NPDC058417]|uniref:DUF397 domain-containing protein n=1 Tax=unclassified Streptomyces TaxID=2593676 RepID=UPI0036601702
MSEIVGPFRKSSYSRQLGDCVEVAPTTGAGRVLRDSKRSDGPLLAVSRSGWAAFVGQFHQGRF